MITSRQLDEPRQVANPAIRADNYQFLRHYIHRESGILLDDDKHYLIEARLLPLLQHSRLDSLDALCDALRDGASHPLRKQVVEAMATHETLFFRDAAPFEALRASILPKLMEERKLTRKLNFWSAAASSGQEAYSLAMMLLEMGLGSWNIEILGTDISEPILARARRAIYMQIEVNRGLPAPYLVKYFDRHGLEWEIKDQVRQMVRFEQFDLRAGMRGKGPFDVILCRNVLIYFDVETKKKILGELRGALLPGGLLLLGGAETTLNLDERFTRVTHGRAVVYQAP